MFSEEEIRKFGELVGGIRKRLTDFAASDQGKELVRWAVATQPPEEKPREQLVFTGRHESVTSYLRVMALAGWYLDPSWAGGTEHFIVRHLAELSPAEADDAICDLVEEKAETSVQRLEEDYPTRGRLFRAAFAAHARKEYALSIPLMLAQADGICWDRFGVQLHARSRGVPGAPPVLASLFGDESDPFRAYLSPLLEIHPVAFGPQQRADAPDLVKLNRHAILHGESIDYDTRANGCRAMSYLRFVGWVLSHAKLPGA